MLSSEEEELQAELHAALDLFFEQDPVTFLPHLQALQNRVRDLAPSLSPDTLQLAHDVAHTLAMTATVLKNVTEYSQQCTNNIRNEQFMYMENEGALSEDEDEPETNWEALRDWFLAHLAQPFPTPSQCRRLVKECHIDSDELNGWLERMRELTHWNDLFSSWARSDQHTMKALMKLVQKEIDLGIPEHRCRTSSIQRVEVERLRQAIHKVYKPGPSEWWTQFDTLSYSDEEDGFKEDEDDIMWPPSDDDDAQELTAVDPDYHLTTFFDANERSITAPIPSSNSPPISATFTNVPKVFSPRSALQREGREWLDTLERVTADTVTAYAEMERIAIKMEDGGDESVAAKLEAAEIRFEEAQKKEEEIATVAVRRMQALQAQAKYGKHVDQPSVKVEPTILLWPNEPIIKTEFIEEVLVPTTKVEVDAKSDEVNPKVAPARLDITLESVVEPGPSAREREITVEVNGVPSLILKTGPDAAEVRPEIREVVQEIAGQADPEVKEVQVKDEPTSPLNLSNKSELDTVVVGTFQPLEPEEIEELVACFAPLSATIVQLDPTATIVPPGLIDLSKSRAHAQGQQVVVEAEPVEVGLNDEPVIVPISFSLKEVISLPANSSTLPQVQILIDPQAPPAHPAPETSIPAPVPAASRCIRGMPRRTEPQLAVLHGTPQRFTSVSSTSSASGSYSGSSACSSDSEIEGDTTPINSPITKHSSLRPPSQRTKAPPPRPGPTSPSQRKRKRGSEEGALQYDPSNPLANRPMKRVKGFKQDPEEAHATLRAEFVPPPLPKVSLVSESRKAKRKRCEEDEEESRVTKRTRIPCHVHATQEDHLERPCHSMIALVLDPTLTPQPSPKLENVSGLPDVKYTSMSLEEIGDGPRPTVEEIKKISLEALALMTDQEFSAFICSPESWELKCLEYEPNEELFEDPPLSPPTPTKVLIAPPSPPMSAVVALPPAQDIAPGPQLEVENPIEPISVAPAEEVMVKQNPIEPVLGLVLAPVLPCAVQTMPELIPDAPHLATLASDARDSIRCESSSSPDSSLSIGLQSLNPTPPLLVRQTRTKRAVGMMDTLSLSGKRVTPPLCANSKRPVRTVRLRGGRGRLEDGARTLVLPTSVRPKR